MKEYLIPVALAGVGVAVLFHHKTQTVSPVLPSVPVTHSRSWKSTTANVRGHDQGTRGTSFSKTSPQIVASPIADSANKNILSNSFDQPYIFFQEKLSSLNDCLIRRNCAITDKGPKDYDATIYSEMVRTLKTLTAWQARHHYQDSRIPELMGDFLLIENAYIKIEALKIMGTQPPAPENLELLLENVLRYAQPEVIPLGVKELARYKTPEQRKRIDDTVEQVLLQGGVHAATELAKEIKPLLSGTNRSRYMSVVTKLQQVPLSEEIALALRENL